MHRIATSICYMVEPPIFASDLLEIDYSLLQHGYSPTAKNICSLLEESLGLEPDDFNDEEFDNIVLAAQRLRIALAEFHNARHN